MLLLGGKGGRNSAVRGHAELVVDEKDSDREEETMCCMWYVVCGSRGGCSEVEVEK